MTNFIIVVLEKCPVNIQQYLLIYGVNDYVSKDRSKEASKQTSN